MPISSMFVYADNDLEAQYRLTGLRAHPWTTSTDDPNHRYVDFKDQPDLIPDVLEDFQKWQGETAVQEFFEFLRYANRPGCNLETNDCGFKGVSVNDSDDCPFGRPVRPRLRSSGRVMFLFRAWEANVEPRFTDSLMASFHKSIASFLCPSKAMIGLSFCPVAFPSLEGEPEGRQLVASWWTWGDNQEEVLDGLSSVAGELRSAVDLVDTRIQQDNSRTL